jgi:hypothetical protein
MPKNADYYFPSEDVIVELKCFEKDLFSDPADVDRLFRIVERHGNTVTGQEAVQWALGLELLPPEYRRDMLSLARRSVEEAVRTANEQIKSTKQALRRPSARGLVFLANDGNYFLQPAEAVALISKLMEQRFRASEIDGFVYFTANTVAEVPGVDHQLTYWIPAYREEGDVLGDFVDRLGARWQNFSSRKIGEHVPTIQTDDVSILKHMKLIHFPKTAE